MTSDSHQPRLTAPLFAGILLVIQGVALGADDRPRETFLGCRSIPDDQVRVDCYDDAVDRLWRPEAETKIETESEVGSVVELHDDVGRESLAAREKDKRQESIVGYVVECAQDATGTTLFHFDNGQVWKQKSDSRFKIKECRMKVTIEKDLFGYKMRPEGGSRRIRIARVR